MRKTIAFGNKEVYIIRKRYYQMRVYKMQITAYHGTDLKIAHNICNTGFKIGYNEKHWLGNGVYFFIDYDLADWWTSNPSKTFGSLITQPSILQVEIDCPENEILDLRSLNNYREFTQIYIDDFLPDVYKGVFDFSYKDSQKLRCAFCDYLFEEYHLSGIIGNFHTPWQSYLPSGYHNIRKKLNLYYIETQLCLFDTSKIIKKTILQTR